MARNDRESWVLYANLMEEVKIRHASICNVVNGSSGIVYELAKEYCYLQLRMICELIALGCLVAHGDIRAKKQSLLKTYAADLIMKELTNLHADFYPTPVIIKRTSQGGIHLDDFKEPYLSKSDLMILTGKCGDKLHRGTIKKILSHKSKPVENYDDIIRWLNKIIALLNSHKIALHGSGYLVVTLKNSQDSKVHVAFAAPVGEL